MVVEDVVGDTNLELFVAAHIGGDWIKSLQLEAAVKTVEAPSPIVLGDTRINGDGHLDLVQVIRMQERVLVLAVVYFSYLRGTGNMCGHIE